MKNRYYSEDTESRKQYFDKQFLSNAKQVARDNQITLNRFLANIRDFESFKQALKIAWSNDSSLLNYFEGMSSSELLEFYNRPLVQGILNREEEAQPIPVIIRQVEGKNREYFRGLVLGKMVVAYKDFVKINGKSQVVYRDSRGRFTRVK